MGHPMIQSKTTTKVTGQDRVNKLLEIVRKNPHAHVQIGFFEGAGHYQGSDAPQVVEVALWNEFGTQTSPARPFVGPAIDKHAGLINRWREEMITNIITKNWTVKQCLEAMGFRIKTLIENEIKSNVPPPNAISTTRSKMTDGKVAKTVKVQGLGRKFKLSGDAAATVLQGRQKTNTLRDTDTMLRSVTYRVVLE